MKKTTLKLIVLSSVLGMGSTGLMAGQYVNMNNYKKHMNKKEAFAFIEDNYENTEGGDAAEDKFKDGLLSANEDSINKRMDQHKRNAQQKKSGNSGKAGRKFSFKYKKIINNNEQFKITRGVMHDQKSYKNNKSGLVNAKTAALWINDWKNNKPAGVEGRLFVMQVGLLPGAKPFIKHDDVNVFTFNRTAGCTTTGDSRFDGISDIPMPVFGGGMAGMDGAFWAYDIDPQKDMLLVLVASDEPKNMALATRFLWTMKYWGMDSNKVALMNGTAMYMFNPLLNPEIAEVGVLNQENMFTEAGSEYLMAPNGKLDFGDMAAGRYPAPRTNFKSIKTLNHPTHFDTFASMEDMRNVVDANNRNNVILDGRSAAEFKADGTKKSKTEGYNCGIAHDQQCYSAIEGHIKGARNLEYTSVINRGDYIVDLNNDGVINERDSSMTFKSKKELKNMFKRKGVKKNSDVYTYCRTGTRSSLVTYASNQILGLKTHMYDGSWIQCGKLADNSDTFGKQMIDVDSPWRTDTPRYTSNLRYNNPIEVGEASERLNDFAEKGAGNAIVEEDIAYKIN